MANAIKLYGVSVRAVVTDQVGQCARAKRILSVRFPHVVFGRCFAHQMNLVVKDMFTEDAEAEATIEKAHTVVAFYNRSTAKYLPMLKKECVKIYGKFRSLKRVVDTRWNSAHGCLASLLRIQSAPCIVGQQTRAPPPEIMLDSAIFSAVKELEVLLRPLVVASMLMQRDTATLADVLHVFGTLLLGWSREVNYDWLTFWRNDGMSASRREQQEQPLFFIANLLHPYYVPIFVGEDVSVCHALLS
ncbi:TPA: hypothetical protein N0F65_010961 [Lagenidium giganteum]|uniref:Transposase n=1 Tax=Lagenidium giganteum TaxID=4803 RepID=A0AAV2ZAS9_9STRA|nr:TPA: hypothetical protein N0F65_010961 [Lagenidium giganteum]